MGREAEKEMSSEEYLDRLKDGLIIVETIDKIVASLIFSASTVK